MFVAPLTTPDITDFHSVKKRRKKVQSGGLRLLTHPFSSLSASLSLSGFNSVDVHSKKSNQVLQVSFSQSYSCCQTFKSVLLSAAVSCHFTTNGCDALPPLHLQSSSLAALLHHSLNILYYVTMGSNRQRLFSNSFYHALK